MHIPFARSGSVGIAAARAKIDAYYDRGFRKVRIPITWTDYVGGDLLVYDPCPWT